MALALALAFQLTRVGLVCRYAREIALGELGIGYWITGFAGRFGLG